MPDHDPREPWYLCYAHTDADIDETLNVMADAVRSVGRRRRLHGAVHTMPAEG